MRQKKGKRSTMPHFYKMTKHPQTHQFELAAWLDVGRFYYVAFPDGSLYLETYCAWECQDEARGEEEPPPLQRIA
jgi:hypothetical protein